MPSPIGGCGGLPTQQARSGGGMAQRAWPVVGLLVLLYAIYLVSLQTPGRSDSVAPDAEHVTAVTAEESAASDLDDAHSAKRPGELAAVPGVPLLPMPGRFLYVSPTGSDDNPGTQGAPFATIQRASEEATATSPSGVDGRKRITASILATPGAVSSITYLTETAATASIVGTVAMALSYQTPALQQPGRRHGHRSGRRTQRGPR